MTRVRSLLPPDATVLDFGAGRGKFEDLDPPGLRVHTDLRPFLRRLVAFDIDEAVLDNAETEEAHFAPPGEPLPFDDNSFDLIYSTWVVEHIADPEFYCKEITRVLKPGGWFCALTPNKWGVVGLGVRLIPESLHARVLKVLSPGRDVHDTFPTTYRLNRLSQLETHFPGWENGSFYFDGAVSYDGNSPALFQLWRAVSWLSPTTLSKLLLIFVRKPQ